MRKTFSTNLVDTGGHAAVFYDEQEELWHLLAEYFYIGFEENELGILVTHHRPSDVLKGFKSAGLDVSGRLAKGDLRLFNMVSTYLPDGRFVADFMMSNVLSFAEDAQQQGYSGLRTAGEMNWLKDQPHFHDEAKVYESEVSLHAGGDTSFNGLCLYSLQGESEDSLANMQDVLETHPSYFYRGEMLSSLTFTA